MQPDETRDTGAFIGTALAELTELARDVHRALAVRLFDLIGGPAAPVRVVHDCVSTIAYESTRLGLRTLPAAAGAVVSLVRDPRAGSADDSSRGHFVLSALNGIWGDRLAQQRESLAARMGMRTHDGRLRRVPENVTHDVGDAATERLVLFVHGLCENDRYWWFGAEKNYGDPRVTYGSRLYEERGWTPLYVAYNSGLHISANALELAHQLERLVAAWPVPVIEIAIVGHSMGGLVVRSAAHQAAELGLAWVGALRHVVGLGTPHLGAPLERFINAGTHAMARLPETQPIATWLNRRSVGIKDLRYGAIVEQDWFGIDPDERLMDRCTAAALLPGVAYSMVSATLSRRPDGFFAHDLLVQHTSAHGTGRTRRIDFDVDRLFHMGGRHHFDLLGDPQVYDRLKAWLAGADGAAGALAERAAPNRQAASSDSWPSDASPDDLEAPGKVMAQ